jgi:transcriptional regulator with XRE-family HTH domain
LGTATGKIILDTFPEVHYNFTVAKAWLPSELARQLRQQFAQKLTAVHGGKPRWQAGAARQLGISRQRLHQYLSQRATPSFEVLRKAAVTWNLTFELDGIDLGPMLRSSPPPAPRPNSLPPQQLRLFPDQAVEYPQAAVKILPGSHGTIVISVTINAAAK